MSAPTLNLEPHENGAEARLDVPDMPMTQRFLLLRAALSALTTGHFLLTAPHVRTLHHGRPTSIVFRDIRSVTSRRRPALDSKAVPGSNPTASKNRVL
jgi:hypothetical protein